MSLETSLELNNKLLTQQNELQTRNINLLEQLLVAMRARDLVQTVPAVEYHEPVSEKTVITDEDSEVPDLEKLDFESVIAYAGLFPESKRLTLNDMAAATAYADTTGANRNEQIDALSMALGGIKRAKELHKIVLLSLSRQILTLWDDLPGIVERRQFAELWLDTKPQERSALKPATLQKSRKGPFYIRTPDGTTDKVNDEAELKTRVDAGDIEINKVEYLQLQEEAVKAESKPDSGETPDYAAQRAKAQDLILRLAKSGYRTEAIEILSNFGAQKLGQVADTDLARAIELAEKALEG